MLQAVTLAHRVVETAERRDDYMMAGQTNLMEFGELSNMERLKQLFDAFNQKREILHSSIAASRRRGCRSSSARSPATACSTTAAS